MKAPPFDYAKPSELTGVFSLLERHGDDARILAGGQSLLATLNMRLSEPVLLIDLSAIDGINGIALKSDCVRIGAMTRHSDIEDSPLIKKHLPLLSMAVSHVAHRAIRNRGTIGGSIAFADPSAEYPACAVALDAVIVLTSTQGERRVHASDFFLDLYTTAIMPNEIITACEFPLQTPDVRYAFDELARRHGDYAIVGLATTAHISAGITNNLILVFMGVGNIPVRAKMAEAAINGKILNAETLNAAKIALNSDLQPAADLYNSAETKLYLAGVLMRRLLERLAA
ncbi:MAG: xanthine dehydrogenase family protein subunit M [Herbaspirillum sp.]